MPTTQRYDIPIRIEVNRGELGGIPAGLGSMMRATMINLEFVDLGRVTWAEARETLESEGAIIDGAIRDARDARHLVELLNKGDDEAYDEDFEGSLGTMLDLGTRAATFALNAADCPTFYSCQGHGGPDAFPNIAFYAAEAQLELLQASARAAGIGLINNNDGALEVFSDRFDGFLCFARELHAREAEFDKVGRPHDQRGSVEDDDDAGESDFKEDEVEEGES
ncbi:MAG: hypothetical protein KF878_17375 [Planctomycetes bacterium]|nr:hypothetical protein [Planctomycetota bacterium]